MYSFVTEVIVGHGVQDVHVTNADVRQDNRVVASITEVTDPGGLPTLGDAGLMIYSVSPHDGGIFVKVDVKWDTDLHYILTFFVDEE
jgi:hypothetical protein